MDKRHHDVNVSVALPMKAGRTQSGEALTEFILTLFRVNNLTLVWGDRLVAPFGLTSARWQVLGAISYADRAQPVAWLARDLGANRQNVQRIVNDLVKEGLVRFKANPHHRRARLVVLTEKGEQAYAEAIRAYDPAVNAMAEELSPDELASAVRVLRVVRDKLAIANSGGDDAET